MAALLDAIDHVCDDNCDCSDHAHDHEHIHDAEGDGGSVTSGAQSVVSNYTALVYYLENDTLRWNGNTDLGTNVIITYSYTDTADLENAGSYDPYGATSYWSYSQAQRAEFDEVIGKYEDVSGVRFVEVDDGAMINIFGSSGGSAGGWADIPVSTTTYTSSGDLTNNYKDMEAGDYGYQVNLHELGHALGLKHPHTGDIILNSSVDNQSNTVMTYNVQYPSVSELGVYDIQAMEAIYGDSSNSSDWTVQTFGSWIKTVASDGDDVMTGADHKNYIQGRDGNDVIIGRDSRDRLLGGNDDDLLSGGRENDQLYGGNGNDVLIGGRGVDILYGNKGDDIFVFSQDDRFVRDKIMDFKLGEDRIDLSATGLDFEDLHIRPTSTYDRMFISGGSYDIVLRNYSDAKLKADDFIFEGDPDMFV